MISGPPRLPENEEVRDAKLASRVTEFLIGKGAHTLGALVFHFDVPSEAMRRALKLAKQVSQVRQRTDGYYEANA